MSTKQSLAIVIANHKRDVSGMVAEAERRFPAAAVHVYDKENPANPLTVPVNKGNEASSYLKFIVDNYESGLPDLTLFCHDEERSWHHHGDLWDRAQEALDSELDYYSLNNFILGDITKNDDYKAILAWYARYCEPYVSLSRFHANWTRGHRGCAQFLVAKRVIARHPLRFYADLYDWLLTTELESALSGRFLEWTWHLFWDDGAVAPQ